MRKKIINTTIILLLIVSLIAVDFITITSNIIAYAIENSGDNNVEFTTYFKDSEGNKTKNIEKAINSEEITLSVNIKVKNNGYLNGKIELTNNNFKFKKQEIDGINEISDNMITLNQINAGEKLEFEIGLQPNLQNKIELNTLNSQNEIKLTGTYVNSEEKEEEITKSENIGITLINPYSEEDQKSTIEAKILTNKNYEINGENKRLLQILVQSGLNGDGYPIKETNLEIKTVEGFEKLHIEDRGTIATNGKEEKENNEKSFNTTQNGNNININIKNEEEEGKIGYIKQGKDNIIITCVYDGTKELNNEEIEVKSAIELYDKANTKIENKTTAQITEEKDEIIGYEIISNQEIYKGKMYAKEEETYQTTSKIDIRYPQIEKNITITEGKTQYSTEIDEKTYGKTATTEYVNSTIDKEKLLKVIGEEGELIIKNTEGTEIAKINKDTAVTKEGKIIIEYDENNNELTFEIKNAQDTGTIKIEHTRKIKTSDENKSSIKKSTNLITSGTLAKTNQIEEKTIKVNNNLKEPETKANIEISMQELKAEKTNEKIQIRAKLLTDKSKYDLYKNPKLEIEFPEEIENVTVNNITVLHDTELSYKSATIQINEQEKKVLSIELEGEQTSHCESSAINGANVLIDCNLSVSAIEENKSENIILKYTNENATNYNNNGIATTQIDCIKNQKTETSVPEKTEENQIKQKAGIATIAEPVVKTDPITVEKTTCVVNNEENYIYERQIQRYVIKVTNNTEETITNIKVTDKIPDEMTYCEITKNTGYNNCYTEDEKTKEYQREIGTLEAGATRELEYFARVKNNAEGNTVKTQAEAVIEGEETVYKSNEIENGIKDNQLQMDIFLVSGTDGSYIKNDNLTYTIRVKNTTEEALKNIKVCYTIPEGVNYDSSQYLKYNQEEGTYYETIGEEVENQNYDPNSKKVTWEIENLNKNEEVAFKLVTRLGQMSGEEEEGRIYNYVTATINNSGEYYSNVEEVKILNDAKCTIKKEVSKQEVLEGEKFEYRITGEFTSKGELMDGYVKDKMSDSIDILTITSKKNGEEISTYSGFGDLEIPVELEEGATYEIIIEVQAKDLPEGMEEMEIQNKASIEADNMSKIESNTVTTTIKKNPNKQENESPGDSEVPTYPNYPNDSDTPENIPNSISGAVWLDENQNGEKDSDEELISNVQVELLDEEGNYVKDTTTNENGKYIFDNLENNNYLVAFKYDTNKYTLTQYQKSGVNSTLDSDALESEIMENGQDIIVGLTDVINIQDNNATNIDVGLIPNSKFDLKLNKYISKITVKDNTGTTVREYNNATLAKIELVSSKINNTIIVIIKATKVIPFSFLILIPS